MFYNNKIENYELHTAIDIKAHTNIYLKRIILWALIAVYTILLPYAFIIYSAIVRYFSSNAAGRIPVIAIFLIGAIYCIYSCKKSNGIKPFISLIFSSIIIYCIISQVDNPNKHIHIPEYIIMSWFIYKAIEIDYNGEGIFILTLLISILLGVFDELEQGIHADRFYGFNDMIVNALSSIIGMLLLMGSRRKWAPGEWTWIGALKDHKISIGLILIGIIGLILTCRYLFNVQENGTFPGIYPIWLLIFNGLYIILVFFNNIIHIYSHYKIKRAVLLKKNSIRDAVSTVHLWIVIPSVILLIMHFLPVYIAISGKEFR